MQRGQGEGFAHLSARHRPRPCRAGDLLSAWPFCYYLNPRNWWWPKEWWRRGSAGRALCRRTADAAGPRVSAAAEALQRNLRRGDGPARRGAARASRSMTASGACGRMSRSWIRISSTALLAYEDKRFRSHWRRGLRGAGAGDGIVGVVRPDRFGRIDHHHADGAAAGAAAAQYRRPRSIESIRAWQLERRYTKDEILELYLTLAPYGGNLEGVRAASLGVFRARAGQPLAGPDRDADRPAAIAGSAAAGPPSAGGDRGARTRADAAGG